MHQEVGRCGHFKGRQGLRRVTPSCKGVTRAKATMDNSSDHRPRTTPTPPTKDNQGQPQTTKGTNYPYKLTMLTLPIPSNTQGVSFAKDASSTPSLAKASEKGLG